MKNLRLGGPVEKGGGESGFTSGGHPTCAPVVSAINAFRQHVANLPWGTSLINARLLAPLNSHGGLSGRGTYWVEAPGFQGEIAALREMRNVAFLADPGPPPPIRECDICRISVNGNGDLVIISISV